MTKRSPRRTENLIQGAGQPQFRTRPAQTASQNPTRPVMQPQRNPAGSAQTQPRYPARPAQTSQQRPARPAQTPQQYPERPAQTPQQSPARPAQAPQRYPARPAQTPQQNPAKTVEKPALHVVEPPFWDRSPVQTEAAKPQTPSRAVKPVTAEPNDYSEPVRPADRGVQEPTKQIRPTEIKPQEQTRKVWPSEKKLEEPPRPLRPSFEKPRSQTRTVLPSGAGPEAETRKVWPSEKRPQIQEPQERPAAARPQVEMPQTRPAVRPQAQIPQTRQTAARPQVQSPQTHPAAARPQAQTPQTRQTAARQQAHTQPPRPTATRPQEPVRPVRPSAAQRSPLPEEEVYTPRRRSATGPSKKVFSKAFKRGFWISWAVFVVLLIAGLVLLWTRLQNYEKGLPDHTIAAVCEEIGKGDLSGLHPETADGRALTDEGLFVDEASISASLKKKNEETPLSYVKVNAESGEAQNVYMIRSGDQNLVKVYLEKASGDEGWKETKTVLFGEDFAIRTLSAQIPSSGTLLLGETEIPRTCITEQGSQISLLSKLIEEGIVEDVPTLDTYTVEGIFPDVQVQMKSEDGKTVACSKTDDVYMAGFEADEAFAKEQSEYVISLFDPYAKYFSGDAEGDVLHDIMLADSPAYESASSADVSWMQEHDDVRLSEERAENFRKYSDNCYSCDIHFLQDIYQNGEVVRTWDTNMTWIMVKDGDYYIADFVTKTEA